MQIPRTVNNETSGIRNFPTKSINRERTSMKRILLIGLLCGLLSAASAPAAVVVGDYTNITAGTFVVSSTDLLQTNYSSSSGEADGGARNGNFPADASATESSGANPATIWNIGSTVTYLLDSKWSIGEVAAYTQWDAARAEQGYTLQVTRDGGGTWSTLGVVSTPDIGGGNSASRTRTYDSSGAPIATGINGVRFTSLTSVDGQGDVYREFDVLKSNLQVGQEQFSSSDVLPSPIIAVSNDLLQTSVTSVSGENGSANVRNGTTGTSAENTGANPAVVWGNSSTTYNLDVVAAPLGYDISEIRLFSGWNDGRAGQSYEIFYSLVGNAAFTSLGTVFAPASNGSLLTRTYNLDSTAFLTGVDAIRFTQINNDLMGTGTVFREFDVLGVASVPEPATSLLMTVTCAALALVRRRSGLFRKLAG